MTSSGSFAAAATQTTHTSATPLPQSILPPIRQECRNVLDLDIEDEDRDDERDAGQEDEPLGKYFQRIDQLSAEDRFMRYLTAPNSNSDYRDATNGYERRNDVFPRAKTWVPMATTLCFNGKVGTGLDGNSSTANTNHGPSHG